MKRALFREVPNGTEMCEVAWSGRRVTVREGLVGAPPSDEDVPRRSGENNGAAAQRLLNERLEQGWLEAKSHDVIAQGTLRQFELSRPKCSGCSTELDLRRMVFGPSVRVVMDDSPQFEWEAADLLVACRKCLGILRFSGRTDIEPRTTMVWSPEEVERARVELSATESGALRAAVSRWGGGGTTPAILRVPEIFESFAPLLRRGAQLLCDVHFSWPRGKGPAALPSGKLRLQYSWPRKGERKTRSKLASGIYRKGRPGETSWDYVLPAGLEVVVIGSDEQRLLLSPPKAELPLLGEMSWSRVEVLVSDAAFVVPVDRSSRVPKRTYAGRR